MKYNAATRGLSPDCFPPSAFVCRNINARFTLIEIVVSIAILALSLTGLLQLLSHSQLRMARAEEQWREMHLLTQGAEYLLLAGDAENLTVPDEFFPYPDYLIDCSVDEAEGLPDDLKDQNGQLPLKKWTIRLLRVSNREERARVIVDRLGYEEAENAD